MVITLEEIYNIDNTDLFFFDHYKQDKPEGNTIYWGELTEVKPFNLATIKEHLKDSDLYLVSKYMQYGDYDNSCMVERSNYRLFMEEYKEETGIYDMSGGYGSTGIAISLNWMLDPVNEEKAQSIIETLNSLNDYPCIDDEDMSNMEYEAFLEALDSFEVRDCNKLLATQYLVDVHDYDEDKLKDILIESDRHGNPSWMIESGGNCYIDTKDLISHVTLSDYYSCLIDYELKGSI
jgi:hypothetical protein